MRVLVTADTIGGVWTYTRELVTHLVRRGHEVVLVSLGRLPTTQQAVWMQGMESHLDFRPTAYKLEWMQEGAADLAASSRYLQEVIRETKPDVLHSSQYCFGALDCDVPKVVVAHSDVVSWWMAVHGCEPDPSDWMDHYRNVVRRGIESADAVVGITRWMLEQVERYHATPALSYIVHNGRSPEWFEAREEKHDFVISAGRLWDEAKQVRLLTQVKSSLPVRIAGALEHPEHGTKNHMGESGVEILGVQSEDEMRKLYADAGVYAATSRYEPFGLAPLEAALSGCAIVANDIAPLREVWGDAALFFARNDAAALESALVMLSDRSLREEYAQRARTHALRHYTADIMMNAYLNVYTTVAKTRACTA